MEVSRIELEKQVQEKLSNMSEKDLKWIYCYYNGFDKWPIVVTDSKDPIPEETEEDLVSGQGVWAGGEECPF